MIKEGEIQGSKRTKVCHTLLEFLRSNKNEDSSTGSVGAFLVLGPDSFLGTCTSIT